MKNKCLLWEGISIWEGKYSASEAPKIYSIRYVWKEYSDLKWAVHLKQVTKFVNNNNKKNLNSKIISFLSYFSLKQRLTENKNLSLKKNQNRKKFYLHIREFKYIASTLVIDWFMHIKEQDWNWLKHIKHEEDWD